MGHFGIRRGKNREKVIGWWENLAENKNGERDKGRGKKKGEKENYCFLNKLDNMNQTRSHINANNGSYYMNEKLFTVEIDYKLLPIVHKWKKMWLYQWNLFSWCNFQYELVVQYTNR